MLYRLLVSDSFFDGSCFQTKYDFNGPPHYYIFVGATKVCVYIYLSPKVNGLTVNIRGYMFVQRSGPTKNHCKSKTIQIMHRHGAAAHAVFQF